MSNFVPIRNGIAVYISSSAGAGMGEEKHACLVETTCLPIPLLDRVQRRLPCEVEHEENGNGIVAYEWKHIYELSLTWWERSIFVADASERANK